VKQILTVIFFQLAAIGLILQYAYLHPISCGTNVAAIAFAEARIERDANRSVKFLGTSAENIATAQLVQFVDWRPSDVFPFSVTYQLSSGKLVTVNISPGCGIEYSFPVYLSQSL